MDTEVAVRRRKAPAERRAELVDVAQALFLAKGYERTTINDVIAATGLSKGAFYHHFRAKEDLLEAIVARFGRQALATIAHVDPALNALDQLNHFLAMSRDWKAEHMGELRAVATTLLRPENAMLYHRIVTAVFDVLGPTLTRIIEAGARAGVFRVGDPDTAAEVLLWLSEGRRGVVMEAMAFGEHGDLAEATRLILKRVRAEEEIIDRVLGLAPGSVRLIDSEDEIERLVAAWLG